jgi:hypothetical protein
MFLYIYCYELTITGLLEVKLFGDLLRNGRHLLQQFRILLICTVGGYPASDYIFGRLREVVRTMCGSRTGGWSLPCVMSD